MIRPKYRRAVFAFYISVIMTCIMSLAITLINVGFVADIFSLWMHAWFGSFFIAFPSVFVISPLVNTLVNLSIKSETDDG